jgi:lipopolysaccharide/colanic/teichoic acid biosynthesis glycosyltransferase
MRLSRRVFSQRQAFLVGSRSHLQTDRDFSSEASVAPVGLTSKRIVDIVLALSGIILLAPLLIICFVVTWTSSPWPVIFRHKRIGFNGKTFDCLKFRTMVADHPNGFANFSRRMRPQLPNGRNVRNYAMIRA